MVVIPVTSESCSLSPVVLSLGLTSTLLRKAPSDDPEWGGWSELLIEEGQADGSDGACQEQRERGRAWWLSPLKRLTAGFVGSIFYATLTKVA